MKKLVKNMLENERVKENRPMSSTVIESCVIIARGRSPCLTTTSTIITTAIIITIINT